MRFEERCGVWRIKLLVWLSSFLDSVLLPQSKCKGFILHQFFENVRTKPKKKHFFFMGILGRGRKLFSNPRSSKLPVSPLRHSKLKFQSLFQGVRVLKHSLPKFEPVCGYLSVGMLSLHVTQFDTNSNKISCLRPDCLWMSPSKRIRQL